MSAERRTIIHIDMDAFYAAVEQRDQPALRGKPIAVGGRPPRGVVAAASYEARSYGVHSALPMRWALQRCPQLVCLRPRMAVYQSESRRIFDIFASFTPDVEGLSLDEAFLDVSASLRLWPSALAIARTIKQRIRAETGLSCSVGIAPNKLVAKIASEIHKPDALLAVGPAEVVDFLAPLPVAVLPGLGPKAQARLARIGIDSVAALRQADPVALKRILGTAASRFQRMASGADRRPVGRATDRSLSAERTFDTDLADPAALYAQLATLADGVTGRLRAKQLVGTTVVLKLRRSDFRTFTRQAALPSRCNETRTILNLGRSLLDGWVASHPGARLRLLGIGVKGLGPAPQGSWLDDAAPATATPLDQATDAIRQRFGTPSLTRARQLIEPAAASRRGGG